MCILLTGFFSSLIETDRSNQSKERDKERDLKLHSKKIYFFLSSFLFSSQKKNEYKIWLIDWYGLISWLTFWWVFIKISHFLIKETQTHKQTQEQTRIKITFCFCLLLCWFSLFCLLIFCWLLVDFRWLFVFSLLVGFNDFRGWQGVSNKNFFLEIRRESLLIRKQKPFDSKAVFRIWNKILDFKTFKKIDFSLIFRLSLMIFWHL